MDYIYGELNQNLISVNYEGVETEETKVLVDNLQRLIEVVIKKLPHLLTITSYNGEQYNFDGSQDIALSLKDTSINKLTLVTCTQDDIPYEGAKVGDFYLDVEVKKNEGGVESISHSYCSLQEIVQLIKDETTRAQEVEEAISNIVSEHTTSIANLELNKQDKIVATSADVGKLVGVDSDGNLTLVDAPSGGTKLYKHDIGFDCDDGELPTPANCLLTVISTKNTPFTDFSTMLDRYIYTLVQGFDITLGAGDILNVDEGSIIGFYIDTIVICNTANNDVVSFYTPIYEITNFVDTVTEL